MNNCEKCSNQSIFSIKENKSNFILKNPQSKNICEIKVDGCLIKDNSLIKCDYIFEIYENSNIAKLIYVELKGVNLNHAKDQIISTDNLLKNRYSSQRAMSKKAFIVTTRCPVSSSDLRIIKTVLKKRYGIVLESKNTPCEYTT